MDIASLLPTDPNEIILAHKFDYTLIWGEHWKGEHWKDNMENVQTGNTLGSGHKCNVCNKPFTRECYKKGHYAFCQEWETVSRPAKNEADIRKVVKFEYGERVVGCESKHDGFLKLWIRARDGQRYCVES